MDKAKLALEIQCELDHLRALSQQSSRLSAVTPTDRREWDAIAGQNMWPMCGWPWRICANGVMRHLRFPCHKDRIRTHVFSPICSPHRILPNV